MKKRKCALMYHDVYDKSFSESGFQTHSAEKYKVQEKDFLTQIITISEYCKLKGISKDNIFLTFDDGGSSFYSLIAPILKKYDFKGYFFITTAYINKQGFLTTNEIISLHNDGHFIGVHTHTHPGKLNSLPFHELEDEWLYSLRILETILQTKVLYASIPGGSYSPMMATILNAEGIICIFTSEPTTKIQYLNNNCKVIGRFAIVNTMTSKGVIELLKPISYMRFLQSIKWQLLGLVKMIFGRKYLLIRKYLMN